jgi:hypothetical protein
VKLDFIAGLLLKATEAAGTKDYRGVQGIAPAWAALRGVMEGEDIGV